MPEELLSEDEIAERKAILQQVGAAAGPAGNGQLLNDLEQALAKEKRPFFRIGGFCVGADGRLWVVTTRRTTADTTEVDVFRQDGTFEGTVSLRGAVLTLAIRGDRLAVEVQRHAGDNDAAAAIDLYRIVPDSELAEQ
jgi:sugar lactone lactonase YvrE